MILFYKSDLLDIDAHSRLPMGFFSVFCAHLVFKKLNEISNVIFFQSPSFCLTLILSKKNLVSPVIGNRCHSVIIFFNMNWD